LFLYYNERAIEGSTDYDAGAYLRDGIKTLKSDGVCEEKLWPYVTYKMKDKPTAKCYSAALDHQITSYARIGSLNEMKACLAEGYPFVFGFTVYDSFQSMKVSSTGVVDMPNPQERVIGGHAVLGVGYNDSDQRFIVRNSWGRTWGKKGYFTIPYAYLDDRNLSDDFWTVRDMEF